MRTQSWHGQLAGEVSTFVADISVPTEVGSISAAVVHRELGWRARPLRDGLNKMTSDLSSHIERRRAHGA
jgi:hypothetical protein